MRTNRRCPVAGCLDSRKPSQVMCKTHWHMVPRNLRERVLRLFSTERGSAKHRRATFDAVETVNNLLDEQLVSTHNARTVEP
jgi:hypothetical protein